jgi:hypothetical protein
MLKFLSNLSKFICAQIHFVTTQLAILHNYINLYAQTELVAGSKKEKKVIFPIGLQTAPPKERCAQGLSAFDTK